MLAMATWLLYVADRLLDGIQPSHAAWLQERHHFHIRHRHVFLGAAIPAFALLAWFVTQRMDPAPRLEDFILGAGALLYLLCVHLPFSARRRAVLRLPKELAVGIIFASACVIPAWSRQPAERSLLLAPAVLFAALCWLNCAAIEHWESPLPPAVAQIHRATLWIGNNLSTACLGLVLPIQRGQFVYASLDIAIAVSALLLLWLHGNRLQWTTIRLRSTADAVLLTPVVLLPIAEVLASHSHLHP
jgi:hypothetical protein